MGFNNRKSYLKVGMKSHSWINNPNNAHKLCTKCGTKVDIIWNKNNQENETIYTLKDGTKIKKFVECI